jgi:DNA-binding transcriptional ArsR family regulator
VSEIGEAVGLSPAALTRHLRALNQRGLIEEAHPDFDARVRVFSLRAGSMAALKLWLGETERLWSDELGAFKAPVERSGP